MTYYTERTKLGRNAHMQTVLRRRLIVMQAKEQCDILIIDDDPTIIEILGLMLAGFTPLRCATSGEVGLRLARKAVPDIVFLDVEMPGMTGFEVCKVLKSEQALADVSVFFLSSHESPAIRTEGLRLGAIDFVSKPPDRTSILAQVRVVVAKNSLLEK